jgi:protein TonB
MGKLQHSAAVGLAALLCASLLASCGKEPPRREARPSAAEIPRTPLPSEQVPVPPLPVPIHNLDDYKRALAAKVLAATPDAAFSGTLPKLLTSIVVVEAKIGRDGDIVNLRVVRSRDQKASKLALAAMHAAAPFPKPGKLMAGHHKTFEFSETFLFNKEYRFQIRTLAPVQ